MLAIGNLDFRTYISEKKNILGPINSITALAFIDLSRIGNENETHNLFNIFMRVNLNVGSSGDSLNVTLVDALIHATT